VIEPTGVFVMHRAKVTKKPSGEHNPSVDIREALSSVLSKRETEAFESFFWREINVFRLLDGADKSDKSGKEEMACVLDLTKRVRKLRKKLSEMPRGVRTHLSEAHGARTRTSIHDLLDRLDVDLEDMGFALTDVEAVLLEYPDCDERGRPDEDRRNRLLKCVSEKLTAGGVRKGKAAELAGQCLRAAGIRITDDPSDLAKLIRSAGE